MGTALNITIVMALIIIAGTLALETGSSRCNVEPFWEETNIDGIYHCADREIYRACSSLSGTGKTCYHILSSDEITLPSAGFLNNYQIQPTVWIPDSCIGIQTQYEDPFETRGDICERIYEEINFSNEFGNYTINQSTDQWFINQSFGFQNQFNKSEFKNKSIVIYIEGAKDNVKDLYALKTSLPSALYQNVQKFPFNKTIGEHCDYDINLTPVNCTNITETWYRAELEVTYNKIKNNWDSIKNETFWVSMKINNSDGNGTFNFYFGIGTGTTIVNYTVTNGHLQNNTVNDVFIWEKDFTDNTSSSYYIFNNNLLSDDAVLYFPFRAGSGTNIEDFSGIGNNGTMDNDFWNTTGMKLGNGSITFDGTGGIIIPESTSLDIVGEVTVSAWFKTSVASGASSDIIVCKGSVDDFPLIQYCLIIGASNADFFQSKSPSGGAIAFGTSNIVDNQWHHLVGVFRPNDVVEVWVDGVMEDDSPAAFAESQNNAFDIGIGTKTAGSSDRNLTGNIDEVTIWNRSLSANEIAYHYQRGQAGKETNLSSTRINPVGVPNITCRFDTLAGTDYTDCGNTGDLWLRVTEGTDNAYPSSNFNTGECLLGSCYTGSNDGLIETDFENDQFIKTNTSGFSIYAGNISTANDGLGYGSNNNSRLLELPDNGIDNSIANMTGNTLLLHLNNNSVCGDNTTFTCDTSPEKNNGTFVGGVNVSWECGGVSRLGNCSLNFTSGNTNYITIENEADYDYTDTDSFSSCLWVKKADADGLYHVISKYNSANKGWNLLLRNNALGNVLEFIIRHAVSNNIHLRAGSIADTNWHHICFTYNGNEAASGVELYQDGVKLEKTIVLDNYAGTIVNNQAVEIGTRAGGGASDFNGLIDEVGLWNRTLSPSEVRQFYLNGLDLVNNTINDLEVFNNSGTTNYCLATDGGMDIWNGTLFFGSNAQEQMNVCTFNSTSRLYYSNSTHLLNADSWSSIVSNAWTTSNTLALPRIADVVVDSTNVYATGDGIGTLKIPQSTFTLTEGYPYNNDGGGDIPGTMGLWHMNDNASSTNLIDNSGRGHNGTSTDNTDTMSVAGKLSTALEFNGIDEEINIADHADFNFFNGSGDLPFSVSAWVNMVDMTTARFITKWNSGATEWFFANDAGDQLRLSLYTDASNVISRESDVALTSFESTWIHIAATYDGSESANGIILYINGVAVDITTVNAGSYTGMTDSGTGVVIGNFDAGSNWLDGAIDEIILINRTLSAQEIQNIYASNIHNHSYVTNEDLTQSPFDILNGTINGTSLSIDLVNTLLWIGSSNGTDEVDLSDNTLSRFFNTVSSPAIIGDVITALWNVAINNVRYLLFGTTSGASLLNETLGTAPTINLTINDTTAEFAVDIVLITCNITAGDTPITFGANVTFPNGTIIDSTTTANASFTLTPYPNNLSVLGIYTANCAANNSIGSTSDSQTFIVADTTVPTVSLAVNDTAPDFNVSSVSSTCNATDNGGLSAYNYTALFPNGTVLFNDLTANTSVTFTPSNLTVIGQYNISCLATDVNGNSTTNTTFFIVQQGPAIATTTIIRGIDYLDVSCTATNGTPGVIQNYTIDLDVGPSQSGLATCSFFFDNLASATDFNVTFTAFDNNSLNGSQINATSTRLEVGRNVTLQGNLDGRWVYQLFRIFKGYFKNVYWNTNNGATEVRSFINGTDLTFVNNNSGNYIFDNNVTAALFKGNLTLPNNGDIYDNATCTFVESPDDTYILEVCNNGTTVDFDRLRWGNAS